MPEISEVRIMSEFIQLSSKNLIFTKAEKNPIHKSKTDLSFLKNPFSITSTSRGKELKLHIQETADSTKKDLTFTMGMSGSWIFIPTGEFVPLHTHLLFYSIVGILGMNDVRRFARWDWRDWNPDRSPDPVEEHEQFRKNIFENQHNRNFKRPLFELLLDQKYFNGIGNYLRSTILYHLDIDPSLEFGNLSNKKKNELLTLCQDFPIFFYQKNGGQLSTWKNPHNLDTSGIHELLFYKMGNKILDSNKRTFWYNPKYEKNMSSFIKGTSII